MGRPVKDPSAAEAQLRRASFRIARIDRAISGRRIASAVIGGAIWVGTWVFPLTFIVLMPWSCESATRRLAARASEFYEIAPGPDVGLGAAATVRGPARGTGRRARVVGAALMRPVSAGAS
jgi:hypothetical protein